MAPVGRLSEMLTVTVGVERDTPRGAWHFATRRVEPQSRVECGADVVGEGEGDLGDLGGSFAAELGAGREATSH